MLTVGALALAVMAPAVDPAEHGAEAVQASPALPANPEPVAPYSGLFSGGVLTTAGGGLAAPGGLDESLYQQRQAAAARATRAMQRRATTARPAPLAPLRVRPVAPPAVRPAVPPANRRAVQPAAGRPVVREAAPPVRQPGIRPYRAPQRRLAVAQRRTTVSHRGMVRRTVRRIVERPLRMSARGGMNAVIAYARSQLGRRYVTGGEGRGGFDCSGLTRQAYARAGMRLPHSSRAQAARARSISRSQARPGDLVVGSGHVGIYMGRGMMIDAGNHRTGVVYRKMYRGLRVERIPGS
ncbi:NlpC/P60 family protein [Actinoplanes oblitus]|uniref:NlpC/P60 family protein n=1 Tax=Actinoplanes oblitus TaxID=3040509 RepID=A0ABY8WF14_9ACTN|nr:NlpC/P60 family protein [Actinoplanes oblitus]WIM96446.1 NlpC/P60 family protein [Actinoplanes oblitus]